jgi:dihydrofolate reductase
MGKLVAVMNMTLDGYCDHTAMTADDEIHQHYTEVLRSADSILYGRKTFQLMEFWPPLVKNPSGDKAMDDFAVAIDNIQKIVFSRTLKDVNWRNTTLKNQVAKEDILKLKQQSAKDVLVGSPSLIVVLTQLGIIDEYHLGIQPTVVGNGLQLFRNIKERVDLKLLKTKTFACGAAFQYYETKAK